MDTLPTWGYRPDGAAEIFDLAPGQSLPEGWEPSPACIADPALATAEAVTARSLGRAYAPPVADPVSGFRVEGEAAAVDPDALANALAEIERLTAIIARGTEENERLIAELETADALHESGAKVMDAMKADLDAARTEAETLKADLARMQADGGFSASERDELNAKVASLTEDLARAQADLEAATAPAPKSGRAR